MRTLIFARPRSYWWFWYLKLCSLNWFFLHEVIWFMNDHHVYPWKYVLSSPSNSFSFDRSRYTFKIQNSIKFSFHNPQNLSKVVHNCWNHQFHPLEYQFQLHWLNYKRPLQQTGKCLLDNVMIALLLASSTFLSYFCLFTARRKQTNSLKF